MHVSKPRVAGGHLGPVMLNTEELLPVQGLPYDRIAMSPVPWILGEKTIFPAVQVQGAIPQPRLIETEHIDRIPASTV